MTTAERELECSAVICSLERFDRMILDRFAETQAQCETGTEKQQNGTQ